MPLAGSCSAAISAACHPPEGDEFASSKAVMFGEIASEDHCSASSSMGRCSFTSFEVSAPVEDKWYVGLSIN